MLGKSELQPMAQPPVRRPDHPAREGTQDGRQVGLGSNDLLIEPIL
jgi:hypothetical protein